MHLVGTTFNELAELGGVYAIFKEALTEAFPYDIGVCVLEGGSALRLTGDAWRFTWCCSMKAWVLEVGGIEDVIQEKSVGAATNVGFGRRRELKTCMSMNG